MSEVWAAAAAAVIGGVASSAVGGMMSKKGGSSSGGSGGGGGKLPRYNPPMMPGYIPLNVGLTEADAANADKAAYLASDQDFLTRHPEMVQAENLAQNRILQQQKGNNTLMPQLQSEFMRAGIGNALDNFGDLSGTLAMGSGGEADVARNLGLDIQGFQQTNLANANQGISLGEALFPRRQIGMTGEDVAQLDAENNANQNQFNSANYAAQMGSYNTQYGINANNLASMRNQQNVNSAASAQMWGGIANGIGSGIKSAGSLYGNYLNSGGGQYSGVNNAGYYTSPQAVMSDYGSGTPVVQGSQGWMPSYWQG